MKRMILAAILLGIGALAPTVHADIRWPVATGFVWQPCDESGVINCGTSKEVLTVTGQTWLSAPDRPDPPTQNQFEWGAYMMTPIGCRGTMGNFTGCQWLSNKINGSVFPCSFKNQKSWELSERSTCPMTGVSFDYEYNPDKQSKGLCLIVGVSKDMSGHYALTPWGDLSADDAANNCPFYAGKPPPPVESCSIQIPGDGVLDHGTMPPTGMTQRTISTKISCGEDPQITFVGGSSLELGAGVRAELSTGQVDNQGTFLVSSALYTTDARAGDYRSSVVMMVSPH